MLSRRASYDNLKVERPLAAAAGPGNMVARSSCLPPFAPRSAIAAAGRVKPKTHKNFSSMIGEKNHLNQPLFKQKTIQTNLFPLNRNSAVPDNVAPAPQTTKQKTMMGSASASNLGSGVSYTPIMAHHVANLSQNEMFKLNKQRNYKIKLKNNL